MKCTSTKTLTSDMEWFPHNIENVEFMMAHSLAQIETNGTVGGQYQHLSVCSKGSSSPYNTFSHIGISGNYYSGTIFYIEMKYTKTTD